MALRDVIGTLLVITTFLQPGVSEVAGTYDMCADLYPRWDIDVRRPDNEFTIAVSPTIYNDSQSLQIKLMANNNQNIIKGYYMHVRRVTGDTEKLVGVFGLPPSDFRGFPWYPANDAAPNLNCIVYSPSSPVSEISVTWMAPDRSLGDLRVYATVFDTNGRAVYDVQSGTINARSSDSDEYVQPFLSQVSDRFSSLHFDHCGRTKGCMYHPSDCSGENCEYSVTWVTNGPAGTADFEMMGKADDYLQLELSSHDKNIGDGETYTCITTDDGVALQRGYNSDISPYHNIRHKLYRTTQIEVEKVGDRIFCRFRRPLDTDIVVRNPPRTALQYDLKDRRYTRLYHGKVKPGTMVLEPPSGRAVRSDVPINFNEHNIVKGHTINSLYVAHATMGIISRVLMGALCIFIPRFFKPSMGQTKKGLHIWSLVHTITAILCLVLNIIGIIIMAAALGSWTTEAGAHAVFGIITLVVTALLMGTGVAQGCACVAEKAKNIIKWIHNIAGYVVFFLAYIVMFLGINAPVIHPTLRYKGNVILACCLIFQVLWWCLHEFIARCVRNKVSAYAEKPNGTEMERNGTGPPEIVQPPPWSRRSTTVDWILFAIFCVCTLLFVILLIYFLSIY